MQGLAPGILTAGSGLRYAKWDSAHMTNRVNLTNGDLTFTGTGGSGLGSATIGKSADKWMWEIFINANNNNLGNPFGIMNFQPAINNTGSQLGSTNTIGYRGQGNQLLYWYSPFASGVNSSRLTNDVYTFALDMTGLSLTVYRTRTVLGVDTQISTTITIPAGTWYPACSPGSGTGRYTANFGQNAWDTRTAALRGVLEALELYNIGLFNE